MRRSSHGGRPPLAARRGPAADRPRRPRPPAAAAREPSRCDDAVRLGARAAFDWRAEASRQDRARRAGRRSAACAATGCGSSRRSATWSTTRSATAATRSGSSARGATARRRAARARRRRRLPGRVPRPGLRALHPRRRRPRPRRRRARARDRQHDRRSPRRAAHMPSTGSPRARTYGSRHSPNSFGWHRWTSVSAGCRSGARSGAAASRIGAVSRRLSSVARYSCSRVAPVHGRVRCGDSNSIGAGDIDLRDDADRFQRVAARGRLRRLGRADGRGAAGRRRRHPRQPGVPHVPQRGGGLLDAVPGGLGAAWQRRATSRSGTRTTSSASTVATGARRPRSAAERELSRLRQQTPSLTLRRAPRRTTVERHAGRQGRRTRPRAPRTRSPASASSSSSTATTSPGRASVAVVDLGTPQGVDNVDAYRLMIESFRWR